MTNLSTIRNKWINTPFRNGSLSISKITIEERKPEETFKTYHHQRKGDQDNEKGNDG